LHDSIRRFGATRVTLRLQPLSISRVRHKALWKRPIVGYRALRARRTDGARLLATIEEGSPFQL